MTSPDLTICSVSCCGKSYLHANWEMTAALNRRERFRWIVVENSEPFPERLDQNDARFSVIEGLARTSVNYHRVGSVTQGSQVVRETSNDASYHHAAGLNLALQSVRSRFVLFLDPDFFIIAPNWIATVISHMSKRQLSFFGAPYYPLRSNKYRYFPCASCLFVDLERVSRRALDFTPEMQDMRAALNLRRSTLARWALTRKKPTSLTVLPSVTLEIVRRALVFRLLEQLLGPRARWAKPGVRDTGYRIYRRFNSSTVHRSECVIPVWRHPRHAPGAPPAQRLKDWLTRLFVPDSFCRYPKYLACSTQGDLDFPTLPEVTYPGSERYIWHGRPFAIHTRRASEGN